MTYIAEDVPWYMVDSSVEKPWRDEDRAMSAPIIVCPATSEEEARSKLAMRLLEISEYNFVKREGGDLMYVSAANFILRGGDGVRISGRYYRIREV